jgi:hypothetical protein
MRMEDDLEFQDFTITSVRREGSGWLAVTMDDGWCIGVGPGAAVDPRPGMPIRLYGGGIGLPVRGIVINGVVVRYQTEDEHQAEAAAERAAAQTKRREEFETRRADVEARIAALPPSFRARFERFQAGNPDFLPDFGDYELMCCEQAVVFASRMSADDLRRWAKLPYDGQKAAMPEMSDQHSGNTFSFSVRLALLSIEHPSLVALDHGALTPLVGCEAYGCVHDAAHAAAVAAA